MMPTQLMAVGRVLRPHGVHGELLLEPLTEFPEHLAEAETVYLGEAAEPHTLQRVRPHRGQWLILLKGCTTPEAAAAWRGKVVQVRATPAAPLPPGRYYQHQIIGLEVVTDAGELLGAVTEVLETGANDVYVVVGPTGEILLPALRSVILNVDLEAHRLTVRLMEGLRPG